MSPFSLVEEENRGLEMSGRPTTAGIIDGSLWQAGPCGRGRGWCCRWRWGRRSGCTPIFTFYTLLVYLLYFQIFTHCTPLCFMSTPYMPFLFLFFLLSFYFCPIFLYICFLLKNPKIFKMMKIHKNIKDLKKEKCFFIL